MRLIIAAVIAMAGLVSPSQAQPILLRPSQVFDGVDPHPHSGWSVLVEGQRIAEVGPNLVPPAGTKVVDLPGTTLIPGMIEGH